MDSLLHDFAFDPRYGRSLAELLAITPPEAPDDFAAFWQQRYQRCMQHSVSPRIEESYRREGFIVHDIYFRSTDGYDIGGWLLEPRSEPVSQAIIVGHGYGGRDKPDDDFGISHTAFYFPCFRGISRSRCSDLSALPRNHVIHDVEDRDRYVIGGCVDDLWLAVSLIEQLYPQVARCIGYMGISFGGGLGALAAPWDQRIKRLHLNVPTFGHQPLRMQLPTVGSASSLQAYLHQHRHVADILAYYDAATAARHAEQPVHVAAALFDPAVAPPGQFAIYNAWKGEKSLFVLDAGHFEYPNRLTQEQALKQQLRMFFKPPADHAQGIPPLA
ncbi:MAG: acetylxylan esterase [Methylomonas sp.]|nr:acetylxylan esterase [Methylomonas sp.]PPD22659.1 MAG: deacetylase [Methylomonas sp.]PPD27971.1 MAG: deacetylase [Methylomonas sp.]PPD40080.1 MAG: deacetylase [Methylomonas sp.]PPD54295.1 MAG: deacetylase [Methylomonas sp.]